MNNKIKKFVVITGPTGHLGIEITRAVLNSFSVIGISRTASSIKNEFNNSKNIINEYIPLDIDLSEIASDSIISMINNICKKNKGIPHGLVNNAFTYYPESGISLDPLSVAKSSESFFGIHLRLSYGLAKLMNKNSSIINIGSMYGKVSPYPEVYSSIDSMNPILYGSMKAALIQSSKYLSSILGPSGIRVNSVSYGPFPNKKVCDENPQFIENLAKKTHLKRIGNANEAGEIIEFLLSDGASYISGADISVDGGWTAS